MRYGRGILRTPAREARANFLLRVLCETSVSPALSLANA